MAWSQDPARRRQGCGRREWIVPAVKAEPGWGAAASAAPAPAPAPPGSLAAQSSRGRRALTLLLRATCTSGQPSFLWKDAPDTANE